MYHLKPGIKRHPERRWALPDRLFFGHGACAILAGTFLRHPPKDGFHAERIVPDAGFFGNHYYVTDGLLAFDHHGYSRRSKLLAHHARRWGQHYPGWGGRVEAVDFDLLDPASLERHRMLAPHGYLHDPIVRAAAFLGRIDHDRAMARALAFSPDMAAPGIA